MKSLFIRVLLLLLGSFLVVALVSSLVFHWVSHELDPREQYFSGLSQHVAEELVREHERGNLKGFLRHLGEKFDGRAWIMDDDGRSLTPHPPPPEILSQVTSYPQTIYPYQNSVGRRFIFSHRVAGERAIYRVVMSSHGPLMPKRNRLVSLWLPLLAVIIGLISASALLGYWVLRPIRTIRDTTRKLAADNLQARVPPTITKRKDAFGDLGREFNHMTDRVQSAMDNQNQLFRDVSHELRSPLARIQVAATLSAQKNGGQPELERIEIEVVRLNNLIESLLSLSRLKNLHAVEKQDIDLKTLLQTVVDDANFEFQQQAKTAILMVDEGGNQWGNHELLLRMFENVIRNGMRFTPPNQQLEIQLRGVEGDNVITITDHGQGIETEYLERIFDPFFRGDESRSPSEENHGIGLSMARTIAEIHNGEIIARPVTPSGLQIEITLGRLDQK